jgi:SAM-dependent methyltransferase
VSGTRAWYENDRFWQAALPILFPEERRRAAAGEVENLLRLAGISEGGAVLDLPCGVGRHSVELARRGFRVTGVDRTRLYLEKAARAAQQAGVRLQLVQEDMRRFCRRGAFALAVNLFTSFGYFEDPLDDRRVLENFRSSLQPGGALVMEMMGKEILARIFRERDWHRVGDWMVLEERRLTRSWSWIENRWTLIAAGSGAQRVELDLSHRLYSAAELVGLLESVGFGAVEVFGDLGGSPYDQNAGRLVAVARA